jgi:transcriptional regulator GlxA family with amidase domain
MSIFSLNDLALELVARDFSDDHVPNLMSLMVRQPITRGQFAQGVKSASRSKRRSTRTKSAASI